MKKLFVILALMAMPVTAFACTLENVTIRGGHGDPVGKSWVFCGDENCPIYKKYIKPIKNQNVVYEHDISKDEVKEQPAEQTEEQPKENAGKVYDKKQHRERDVDAINAENEAIDKVTGKLPEPEQPKEEKKEPVEKKVIKEIGKFFGF